MLKDTCVSSQTSSIRIRTGGSPTRDAIAASTPVIMQPFLTWLTACPIDGETHRERAGSYFMWVACTQLICGISLAIIGFHINSIAGLPAYIIGITIITAALGLLQVSVFHYCSHKTVFQSNLMNVNVGRLISALCLLPDFDRYQSKHMRHHSHKVLLTDEDEFVEFVVGRCDLKPGLSKRKLWTRVLLAIVSPYFHICFIFSRLSLSTSNLRTKNGCAVATAWLCALLTAYLSGFFECFAACILVPFSVMFQVTIVLRTLCEHHVPLESEVCSRDRTFSDQATRPVFAGVVPPLRNLQGTRKAIAWIIWWSHMLTVQLLFRVVVLVGDAARHDLHHARPSNRDWPNYMRDRYPSSQSKDRPISAETWGAFATIDACLASISISKQLPVGSNLVKAVKYP